MQEKKNILYEDDNRAYDLSIYAPKPQGPEEVPEIKVVSKRKPKQKLITVQNVALALILVVMTAFMLYNRAVLTEIGGQIATQNGVLNELQSETERLSVELDRKMSLNSIENYATTQLGLSKMQKYQVEYVNLSQGDQVELTQKGETQPKTDRFAQFVDMLKEYLKV
ncbi:hypothetical protein [Candidatus Soleaferrea massiliensis]|uniref:hypothetical protein n=1 Tax=Candidatus Soleaferrea massiliensis TaxID=1470354 RepID=UPI00058FA7D6|nr:hypothetical protein [Candidatus Soleaferrea massiliensis]